jgi:hypothetical protein
LAAPELPSILQRWVDHDAARARLIVAVAGSSQRMMQGLVLSGAARLHGGARDVLDLGPFAPTHRHTAFRARQARAIVALYAAWGGIPGY